MCEGCWPADHSALLVSQAEKAFLPNLVLWVIKFLP